MNATHPLLKFAVFTAVCLAFTAWLVVMIGNISFESRQTYAADFDDVQGLLVNDDVKISGVTVGKVRDIEHLPRGRARVEFSVREGVDLPEDSTVTIRWRNVMGLRFLYVEPGAQGQVVAAPATSSRSTRPAPQPTSARCCSASGRSCSHWPPNCRTSCCTGCPRAWSATRRRSAR